jgi:hypothetical protein
MRRSMLHGMVAVPNAQKLRRPCRERRNCTRFLAFPLYTRQAWIDKLVLWKLKIAVALQRKTVHFVMGV